MFYHFELSLRFASKHISATDLDSQLNGETEYVIWSGNENAAFLIDSARGTLSTNTVLNHVIGLYAEILKKKKKSTLFNVSLLRIFILQSSVDIRYLQSLVAKLGSTEKSPKAAHF